MKIRNGFVSNSSSSSFIIGIGNVDDEVKLRQEIGNNNYIKIDTVEELIKSYSFRISSNKIILESFGGEVSTTFNDKSDLIVFFDECEGDDSDFWDEEYEEYDYDIDLDFFDKSFQEIYEILNKEDIGIVDSETTYGAGRDG